MPSRPARNCTKPGCNGVIRNGVCSVHGSLYTPDDRASAYRRGYGGTWRKVRRSVLAEQPLCVECQRYGRVTVATDVHHVTPKRKGGTNTGSNLVALCHSCHSKITARGG